VLTHFSERYTAEAESRFAEEAARAYDGDIVLAKDLDRVPMPARLRQTTGRPVNAPG
jgi:ribonuclease Z